MLRIFLAGDLGPADARRFDEHVLQCDACWRAVHENRAGRQAAQLLRQPAPPGLADRVAFAVEVAAASARPPGQQPARAVRRRRLAGAGTLTLGVLAALIAVLLPAGPGTSATPAAVAAVARYAQAIPAPAGPGHTQTGRRVGAPAEVGRPVTVTAGGQRIVLRTWRLGGTEAVVAVSQRPFPMPASADAVPGGGMAWSARLGRLGLYCINGRTSELVAAPVPAAQLAALAASLPLT